jgi:hypothetical protein
MRHLTYLGVAFFKMFEPRIQYFFNAPEFSAPSILERRLELTDAAI